MHIGWHVIFCRGAIIVLTLYDCSRSRKKFSFSTTSSSSLRPWRQWHGKGWSLAKVLQNGAWKTPSQTGLQVFTCWAALSDSNANSTERPLRDFLKVAQVLWEEARGGIDEASEPSVLGTQERNLDFVICSWCFCAEWHSLNSDNVWKVYMG